MALPSFIRGKKDDKVWQILAYVTGGVGLDTNTSIRKEPKDLVTAESKTSGTEESDSEDDLVIAHHSNEKPSEGESNGEESFEQVNELPHQTRSGALVSKYCEQFLYFWLWSMHSQLI